MTLTTCSKCNRVFNHNCFKAVTQHNKEYSVFSRSMTLKNLLEEQDKEKFLLEQQSTRNKKKGKELNIQQPDVSSLVTKDRGTYTTSILCGVSSSKISTAFQSQDRPNSTSKVSKIDTIYNYELQKTIQGRRPKHFALDT